jgi:probable phosphoglycerate mutase
MATLLLLVRHAVHDTVGRVLCGRSPGVHLGAIGRAQAARLGRKLRRDRPVALFASPQPRAQDTAEEMAPAFGLAIQTEPALDEIDFGDWTGRDFATLEEDARWRRWNAERATARPPGGECMAQVQARLLRWTGSLPGLFPGATVLAVSHADVIKAAVAAHLGLPLDSHWRIEVSPGSVTALELWDGGGRLRFLNDTSSEH